MKYTAFRSFLRRIGLNKKQKKRKWKRKRLGKKNIRKRENGFGYSMLQWTLRFGLVNMKLRSGAFHLALELNCDHFIIHIYLSFECECYLCVCVFFLRSARSISLSFSRYRFVLSCSAFIFLSIHMLPLKRTMSWFPFGFRRHCCVRFWPTTHQINVSNIYMHQFGCMCLCYSHN